MAKKRKAKKTKIKRKRTAKKNKPKKKWSTPKVKKWLPPKSDALIVEWTTTKLLPAAIWVRANEGMLKIKNPKAPAATRAADGTF
jgi:hypothetical protein